jgi:5-methylcytosine-specific restriction endonuclease McrA
MKKHHYYSHGESIAKDSANCSSCGSTFEYYPSDKKGVFCPSCADNSWGNQNLVNRKGRDHPNYNSVKVFCSNCDSEIYVSESNLTEKNYCDMRCYADHRSKFQQGEKNPNYKGGEYRSSEFYQGDWQRIRRECIERDGGKCRLCEEDKGIIDVHHIEPVREFDKPNNAHTLDNVVCLCRSCHLSIDHGDESIPKDLSISTK